ncbi:MAG: asparagine--tRNA ligase, partial [Clostridia bacterium]|nr:asparagine--tRNA ligase [Clostridia bacterium]
MKRTRFAEIYADQQAFGGKTVTVGGWVRTVRDSKAFAFLELNDGSCFKCVQVVAERDILEGYDELVRLNVGSSVVITGTVVLTPEMKQPFEIKAASFAIEGTSTPDYPLQKKRHSIEFLRENAYLRPRTNLFNAVFRVRSEVAFAIHDFFHSRGFVYVHTPLITGSDCEGAGEM